MKRIITDESNSITFCKVSIDNDNKWIHGIITYVNFEKNIAEIFLSARYFKKHLKEGNRILIKSLNDNNETLFSASITRKVISIRKQSITVRIDKVMSFKNQRRFERFHLNYPCKVSYGSIEHEAILSDISFGGGMLHTDAFIYDNSIINLDVYVSSDITISLTGKTVRKENTGNSDLTYGVELVDIDEQNNMLLSELICFLTEEKNHIAKEWRIFNMLKYGVYTISVVSIFVVVFIFFVAEAI